MKIVMIGSGNVATQLGLAFTNAGHHVIQVFSRNELSAGMLSKKLSCSFTTNISDISASADVYVIALTDEAIKPFLKKFRIHDKVVIHTSGSVSLSVFGRGYKNYGVLYPVQTFSMKRKVDVSKIPFCIESNNLSSGRKITSLAKTLSSRIHFLNSSERKVIHLAAVFSNNFSNHLFAIAEKMLKQKNVSFDILRPLILETAIKVQHDSPFVMQTGPAKRGDQLVLDAHLKILKQHKRFRQIYKLMSESISDLSGIRL